MISSHSTLIYLPNCSFCTRAIRRVSEFYVKIGQPLVIQRFTKPFSTLPGMPALIINKGIFNTEQEIILIGRDMADYLVELESKVGT